MSPWCHSRPTWRWLQSLQKTLETMSRCCCYSESFLPWPTIRTASRTTADIPVADGGRATHRTSVPHTPGWWGSSSLLLVVGGKSCAGGTSYRAEMTDLWTNPGVSGVAEPYHGLDMHICGCLLIHLPRWDQERASFTNQNMSANPESL